MGTNPNRLKSDTRLPGHAVAAGALVVAAYQTYKLSQEKRRRQQAEAAHQESYDQSRTDELTRLPNRLALRETYEKRSSNLRHLGRRGNDSPLLVAMIDLDDFKAINSRYNHTGGDRALQVVAGSLAGSLRTDGGDVVGRYGGDEFMAFIKGASVEDGMQVAERMRSDVEKLSQAHPETGAIPTVTIGLGVVDPYLEFETVHAVASEALMRAKNHKQKNRVHFLRDIRE